VTESRAWAAKAVGLELEFQAGKFSFVALAEPVLPKLLPTQNICCLALTRHLLLAQLGTELAWGRVLHAAGDDVALGRGMHPCMQRMSDWPVDSCAGHTVKTPSRLMMQPTDSEHGVLQNCGDGSSKLDTRGANEASVTSDLKVRSKQRERIGWNEESGP
jgi:hypothetical protein